MMRHSLIPLVLVAALAGCSSPPPDITPPTDAGVSPHVDHVRVQYAPAFAPGRSDLPEVEATRLEAFVDQTGVRPNDHVYVATAPNDPLAAARVDRITRFMARYGIGVEKIAPPEEGVAPNHVVVLADRFVVTPPACPDWSGDPATGHGNVPNDNFGCADASNLAQMIDNPRDLVMGRPLARPTGDPALAAEEHYRTGQVKPLGGGSASGSPGMSSGGGSSASGGSTSGGQ